MLGCVKNCGIYSLFFLEYVECDRYCHLESTIFEFVPREYNRKNLEGIWGYLDVLISHVKVKGREKTKTFKF